VPYFSKEEEYILQKKKRIISFTKRKDYHIFFKKNGMNFTKKRSV
jgi:hypothetical protein